MFDPYLSRWNLVPDGAPLTTPAARLLPVRQAGVPAMLKVSVEEDERQGGVLMTWWAVSYTHLTLPTILLV